MDGLHLLVLTVVFLEATVTSAQDSPVVTTIYGDVIGNRKQADEGFIYDEYLAIPFGAPPVEELRWVRPQPPEPWEGVRNCTVYSRHCVHFLAELYELADFPHETDEDCLYLNVWVPGGVQPGTSKPVMLYYFGGAFMLGTGAMYPGYELAHNADVIVVTFNYRLSSIGWLSTEDTGARGNYGLWDGHAALVWIRDNIDAFGGDPARVTVFGQSAGGMMASHNLVSPATRGLFRSAIDISGSSTSSIATMFSGARRMAEILADYLGCPTNGTSWMMECLRQQDADDLDSGAVIAPPLEGLTPSWRPVVDEEFVIQDPRDSFALGLAGQYDVMTGSTFHDSAGFLIFNFLGWNSTSNGPADDPQELEDHLRDLARSLPGDSNATFDRFLELYPNLDHFDVQTRARSLTALHTDQAFRTAAHVEASLHSGAGGLGKTFLYNYQYRHSFFLYPPWVNGSHLDDIYAVIGSTFLPMVRREVLGGDFNDVDYRMRDILQTYYHNFVYNGDPNVGRSVPTPWTEYSDADKKVVRLSAFMGPDSLETETSLQIARHDFWRMKRLEGESEELEDTELLGAWDDYTDEYIRGALDEKLPQLIPGYYENRDRIQEILLAANERIKLRRAENLEKWGYW